MRGRVIPPPPSASNDVLCSHMCVVYYVLVSWAEDYVICGGVRWIIFNDWRDKMLAIMIWKNVRL